MFAIVISSIASGIVVSTTGNYWYFMVFGSLILYVGAELLHTLRETSSDGIYIGYQVSLSVLCKLDGLSSYLGYCVDYIQCRCWRRHAGESYRLLSRMSIR
jgi:hypothetical protein